MGEREIRAALERQSVEFQALDPMGIHGVWVGNIKLGPRARKVDGGYIDKCCKVKMERPTRTLDYNKVMKHPSGRDASLATHAVVEEGEFRPAKASHTAFKLLMQYNDLPEGIDIQEGGRRWYNPRKGKTSGGALTIRKRWKKAYIRPGMTGWMSQGHDRALRKEAKAVQKAKGWWVSKYQPPNDLDNMDGVERSGAKRKASGSKDPGGNPKAPKKMDPDWKQGSEFANKYMYVDSKTSPFEIRRTVYYMGGPGGKTERVGWVDDRNFFHWDSGNGSSIVSGMNSRSQDALYEEIHNMARTQQMKQGNVYPTG